MSSSDEQLLYGAGVHSLPLPGPRDVVTDYPPAVSVYSRLTTTVPITRTIRLMFVGPVDFGARDRRRRIITRSFSPRANRRTISENNFKSEFRGSRDYILNSPITVAAPADKVRNTRGSDAPFIRPLVVLYVCVCVCGYDCFRDENVSASVF